MARIEIVNWGKFQHYSKRTPPWIKLHRSLQNKREWRELDCTSAKMLVDLWMLASEDSDGAINLSTEDLAWRLRISQVGLVAASLIALEDKGFINLCEHDARTALAGRQRVAAGETEQSRGRADVQSSEAKASGVPPAVEDPKEETLHGFLMPILRQRNYDCDQHDGSIIKALGKKGVKRDDIEAAVIGLAMMRDTGKLEGFGLGPLDKLSMRILYAASTGKRPIWTDAAAEYYRHKPRSKDHALKPMSNILKALA
jgi:hypothetical protein